MPMSVFISHVFEDLSSRDKIHEWSRQGKLGANVVIIGESADVRQHGHSAIRNQLSPKLTGAGAVLVLVGDDTHNHSWVDYEVNHALSSRKKVVAVRLAGTTGAGPVSVRSLGLVAFDPAAIAAALNR
jgi:hypothetical protein